MTVANGNVANADDILNKVQQIYTGSALDTSTATSPTFELDVITDTLGYNYLKIKITANTTLATTSGSGTRPSQNIKIETKDVGGAYSDSLASTNFNKITGAIESSTDILNTLVWHHTLTNNEKANGIQVRISVINQPQIGSASFTNKQIVQELV